MKSQVSGNTYVQTGHRQLPRSQLSWRYDSRSKHCVCLQSWPLAGNVMRLYVIGHFRGTFIDVCSMTSLSPESPPLLLRPLLKCRFILFTLCSVDSNRLRNRPWSTLCTLGLWTSCRTNKWDCKEKRYKYIQ